MITFVKHYFSHSDARGRIDGLINTGLWEELNLIQSQKNSIRGHNYHQKTKGLFVILEGEIKVVLQKVDQKELIGNLEEYIVRPIIFGKA